MANRDLLADAIADAKAVKEVAIANAKGRFRRSFTPHLKDMLAQKINEMEDLEETELSEVDKEKKKWTKKRWMKRMVKRTWMKKKTWMKLQERHG